MTTQYDSAKTAALLVNIGTSKVSKHHSMNSVGIVECLIGMGYFSEARSVIIKFLSRRSYPRYDHWIEEQPVNLARDHHKNLFRMLDLLFLISDRHTYLTYVRKVAENFLSLKFDIAESLIKKCLREEAVSYLIELAGKAVIPDTVIKCAIRLVQCGEKQMAVNILNSRTWNCRDEAYSLRNDKKLERDYDQYVNFAIVLHNWTTLIKFAKKLPCYEKQCSANKLCFTHSIYLPD